MALGISSVKIGGVTYSALLQDFQIVHDISSRIGTATLDLVGAPATIALTANQAVEIKDSNGVLIFAGTVGQIVPYVLGADNTGHGKTKYSITCRDYATLLDQAIIPGPVSYGGVTDQFIIQALLSTYVSGISNAGVSSTTTVNAITFENISVRQALENIIQLTGCEFYVDVNKVLQYHSPTATAAPFSVAEPANGTTSFPPVRKSLQHTIDFTNATNYVSVIGAIGTAGTPFSAIVQDATSQGLYGVIKRTIIDRSLQSNAACTARGNVELANYKNPQISGVFNIKKSGLDVGQLLTMSVPSMGIGGSYLIRKMTAKWVGITQPTYTIEYGAYRPDLYRFVRLLATNPPDQPYTPVSTIPSGIISIANFAASVRPVAIVTSLPTLPDTNYPSGSTVVLTSDGLLYRNNGGTWTKVVNTTDLQGTVSAAQIAANAIIAGKIAANAVTTGTIAAGVVTGTVISATANIIQSNIGGSGVTTDISQIFDSTAVFYTGISVYTTSGGSTGARAVIGPQGFQIISSANQNFCGLNVVGGVAGLFVYSSSGPSGGDSTRTDNRGLRIFNSSALPLAQLYEISGSGDLSLNDSSSFPRVHAGVSGGIGFVQFDSSSTSYAARCLANGNKVVGGGGLLSGGSATIVTGLTTIIGFSAILGPATESPHVVSTSGGTVVIASNVGGSTTAYSYTAIGT